MLSPRKPNQASPSKENESPGRTPRDHLKKQPRVEVLLSAISELQGIIVRNGGEVPENLKFGLQGRISLISPSKASKGHHKVAQSNYENEVKKLRVKLNDYQFSLKKMEEDYAQYKVISKLQKQKEIKKLKDDISRLEKQVREDNCQWELKFTEMQSQYERNAKNQSERVKRQGEEHVKAKLQSHQKAINQMKKKCQEKISNIIKQKQQQIDTLTKQNEAKLLREVHNYEEKVNKVEKKHKEEICKVEVQKQQIFIALTSQKKIENNKFEQQRIAFTQLKTKLYSDLYEVRKEKEKLQIQIKKLKDEVILLNKEIKAKQIQKQKERENNLQELRNQAKQFNNTRKDIQKQYKKKYQNLYSEFSKKFCKMAETVRDMEAKKNKKEELFNQIQTQMQKNFAERPPRAEDLQSINKLKYDLMMKNEKISDLQKDLKRVKLERENNDKNYNRIFSAQGNRNKKTLTVDRDSSRQKIYKQANTVDMSLLLKICQKQF